MVPLLHEVGHEVIALARKPDSGGGPPPRRVPTLLARLAAGSWGVAFMTQLVGADNRRARRELDWQPGYTSWRRAVMGPENGQYQVRLGAGG